MMKRGVALIWLAAAFAIGYEARAQEAINVEPEPADERPAKKIPDTPAAREAGKKIYIKRCLPCHGEKGAGDGPTADFLDQRPRDFTQGHFKLRTTPFGAVPTDEDLFRTVSRGVPGTAMPAWKTLLTEEQRWQVLYFEKGFSPKFGATPPPQSVTIPPEPPMTPDSIAKGKDLFKKSLGPGLLPCFICHGENGRGNGPLAPTLRDARGDAILPRNLTKPWQYKGGHTGRDIFMRLSTGLNGTPMVDYGRGLKEEDRWHLAHYVRSLQRELKQGAEVVVKAIYVPADDLPLDPNAPAWQAAPALDVVLTGQVHVPPRNQTPSVDLITVRALYNDREVAFRLEWDDRTKNAAHQELGSVTAEAFTTALGTYPRLHNPEPPKETLRDAAALQFPAKIPDGPVKPHFFLGETSRPVNLWHWKADWQDDPTRAPQDKTVEEQNAAGYKTAATVQPPQSQTVQGRGTYADGRWTVVMKRSLTTDDPGNDIQFERGRLIPVAVHVWDGANGEKGLMRSISSWGYVLLETKTPPTVYAYAVGGLVFAIGLEFWLIRRVRQRVGQRNGKNGRAADAATSSAPKA